MQVCTVNGKTLVLGEDDLSIQACSTDNLIQLEMDHNENPSSLQLFVVIRETTTQTKGKDGLPVVSATILPHGIVEAHDMWEALRIFNEEHRNRVWVPESEATRGDIQIGVDRQTNRGKAEIIRMYRMRKDQIFKG